MADELPPGFTLDRPDELPPGFKPDAPTGAPTGTQTGSIVRGIPIVGPLLDKGVAAMAAAPAAVIPGMSYKDTYNKMISGQDRYEAEHPVASTIGQVAGSTLATVPVARAFPMAFGGATMPGQIGAGAVIGGTDAAVRTGGDLDAIKTGALIGGAAPVMGSVLAPVGQGLVSAGRWAAEHVPGVKSVIAPRVVPPSGQAILDAADAGYKSLSTNVKYDPATLGDLGNLIKSDLYTQSTGSAKVGATRTHAILDTIDSLPPTPSTLHTIRKELQDVANAGGNEGASARYAQRMIDNFLEAPPPNAVISGQLDAATVAQRLKDANANWRAGMNSKEVRDRLTKAQLEAGTAMTPIPFMAEGQALRKNVTNMLKSENASQFLQPADRVALEAVSRPQSMGEGLLRLASGASGTSRPNFHTLIPGGAAYAATGDPITAAALMAGGAGATLATSALSRRAFENADKVIRSAAPYAQSMMRQQLPPPLASAPPINMRPSISAKAHRDEISRLLALQAERQAVEQ